ncbi:hypothetical protein [Cohaesibacter celericrescens]|uniref:hypothetical protein n=1 Tax=Cohaesibacter celericrescens TaxID=2067669 RepID=UPI00356849A8
MTHAMRWTGEAFEPTKRAMASCKERFHVGEIYAVDAIDERSAAEHNRFFAQVDTLWETLPETMQHDFPTSVHLRKRALVETGFCTEHVHPCKSKAEAQRVRILIKSREQYTIVIVQDDVVRTFEPMSQSVPEMGRRQFKKSAEAVEDWITSLIENAHHREAAQ